MDEDPNSFAGAQQSRHKSTDRFVSGHGRNSPTDLKDRDLGGAPEKVCECQIRVSWLELHHPELLLQKKQHSRAGLSYTARNQR
jgi:hypothetical protein